MILLLSGLNIYYLILFMGNNVCWWEWSAHLVHQKWRNWLCNWLCYVMLCYITPCACVCVLYWLSNEL